MLQEDIILKCFPRGEYIRVEDILEQLREQNETSIDTTLPWQVRGLLSKLHKENVLLYSPYVAAYKRIDWR